MKPAAPKELCIGLGVLGVVFWLFVRLHSSGPHPSWVYGISTPLLACCLVAGLLVTLYGISGDEGNY